MIMIRCCSLGSLLYFNYGVGDELLTLSNVSGGK